MKIILESENERKQKANLFSALKLCPDILGLSDSSCAETSCRACWEAAMESVEVVADRKN